MPLPEEIKEKIATDLSFSEDRQFATEGAEMAQEHFDKVITGLKINQQGYIASIQDRDRVITQQAETIAHYKEHLKESHTDIGVLHEYLQKTKQGKIGGSVLKESALLLEAKDKEIERLKGLLKEEWSYANREFINSEQHWDKYCKEHNI